MVAAATNRVVLVINGHEFGRDDGNWLIIDFCIMATGCSFAVPLGIRSGAALLKLVVLGAGFYM